MSFLFTTMKVALIAMIVSSSALADLAPANQKLCGTLRVEEEMGPVGSIEDFILYDRPNGHPVIALFVENYALLAQLRAHDGKNICLKGYVKTNGRFSVLEILD